MKSSFRILFIIALLPFCVKAQDSLSLYPNIYNRLDPVRTFNETYYYNPANMSDYSNYSFNDIQLNHYQNNKKNYLLQEGNASHTTAFKASSYKKQKNNQTIWGSASYQNTQLKNIQWNNNLDLDRIGPLVFADSVGGKTNVQTYHFTGGYNKSFTKFSWGAQMDYQAALSYKTKDPRPKNTTSNLNAGVGANYLLGSQYKAGFYAGINRYIQTSTIAFSSEVQKAALYHMNGLGNYNFYFSSRTNKWVYVDLVQQYQVSLGTTDNSLAFNAGILKGKLTKDTFINNPSYEINRLSKNSYFFNILKTFELSDNIKIGAKVDYQSTEKTGTEIYYTNNTDILQKLLEKDNYHFKTNEVKGQLFFQYHTDRSNLTIIPYFDQQEITENRSDNGVFQIFNYQYIGSQVTYLQQLNAKNMISLQADIYQRSVNKSNKNFSALTKTSVTNWLTNDYNVLSSSILSIESSLRYDVKIDQKTSLYSIFAFDLYRFSDNKNNTQTGITVGVAF